MKQMQRDAFIEQQNRAISAMKAVPHKILVMSGKGGVGKTSVSVNLAYAFAAMNKSVGILDADLHGPNVAIMTGTQGLPVHGDNDLLIPVAATDKVRVLTMASFLPDINSPVAWRGPRKASVIRQFVGQGDWKGTDVLVVDCPPGTGDEPMAVAELIPDADGAIVVTSPQGVSLLDSRKCINFVREMNHNILGIIENFSGFECPECGHRIDLFKSGGGKRAAEELGVPFLGGIPIAPQMVEAGDSGRPIVASAPDDSAARALAQIAEQISKAWGEEDTTASGMHKTS
jgi:Mrp family chromosome partitioning ATPase